MRQQLRHACSQNPLASFSCLGRPFSDHHSQESWNHTRAIGHGDRVDLFPNLAHLGSLPQHPPTYLERARLPAIPALGEAIASFATHACWLAPRVGIIRRPLAVRGDPWHRCVVRCARATCITLHTSSPWYLAPTHTIAPPPCQFHVVKAKYRRARRLVSKAHETDLKSI